MQLLNYIVTALGLLLMLSVSQASLKIDSCASELDIAVSLFNEGNTSAATTRFESLAKSCSQVPQIHHNLGVIAALQQQWQSANQHFERAVATDSRSNMTYSHIQAVHQYRASAAYKAALGVDTELTPPQLSMQNSSHANAVDANPPKTTLHTVSTVEYELFSWWNAAASNETPAWLEHYAPGYPPLENTDAHTVAWSKVGRDISFTAQDVVVVLKYEMNRVEKHTLLLLKLQNNRWKIYQERTL